VKPTLQKLVSFV